MPLYNRDELRYVEPHYEVRPRYLAGSGYSGDPRFAPIPASWPRYEPVERGDQLVVTSPDRSVHVGWDGDGLDELWRIGAYPGTVDNLAWLVTANHNCPPEFIAPLVQALVDDVSADTEAILESPQQLFLTRYALLNGDVTRPLLDAGWTHSIPWTPGRFTTSSSDITSPDGLAVLHCHLQGSGPNGDRYVLRAGPGRKSWMRITFSERVPDHLVAAVTTAVASTGPLVRERHMIQAVEQYVTLTPVDATEPDQPQGPPPARRPASTPLDARRASVTAALQRARSNGKFTVHASHSDTPVPGTPPAQPSRPTPPAGPSTRNHR